MIGDGEVTFTVTEIEEILAQADLNVGNERRFRDALEQALARKAIIALNEEVASR